MTGRWVRSGDRRARWPKRLTIGGAIVGSLVVLMAVGWFWTPFPPGRIAISSRLLPPLQGGLLGTDHFGRDVLSSLMVGAWNSLSVAFVSVALGGIAGTCVGVGVAAAGGAGDRFVMRVCDVLFAFPPIISAMMLAAVLGPGRSAAIVAIAVFMVPVFARVARGSALQVLAQPYVSAARSMGKRTTGILLDHVLPNIAGQLAVQTALQLGLAILTEAGLSFLGLGAPPPTPSWGRMLAESQTYLTQAPWLAIVPGATIALAVLGLNLLGDGLRDRFDPHAATRH